MKWDKNISSTNVLERLPNNSNIEILHITNKGVPAIKLSKRDFFEKKYYCEVYESEKYYYFSSIPEYYENMPPINKDTVRASINIGFHHFTQHIEGDETVLTAVLYLQCDLKVSCYC